MKKVESPALTNQLLLPASPQQVRHQLPPHHVPEDRVSDKGAHNPGEYTPCRQRSRLRNRGEGLVAEPDLNRYIA
jgi:hypothetical protein